MDTEKGSRGDETERETYRMLCIVYPASERLDRNMSMWHRKHTQHSAESAQQLSPRADTESQKRAREEEGGVNISFNSHRLQHDYFLSFMKSYQHILRWSQSIQSSSSSSSWVLHSVSSNKNPPLGWLALYFLSLSLRLFSDVQGAQIKAAGWGSERSVRCLTWGSWSSSLSGLFLETAAFPSASQTVREQDTITLIN